MTAEEMKAKCEAKCRTVADNWNNAFVNGVISAAATNKASGAMQCLNAIAAIPVEPDPRDAQIAEGPEVLHRQAFRRHIRRHIEMKGDLHCVDGRLMRHDPQFDDPDLETDIGQCPDCSGDGCGDWNGDYHEPVRKVGPRCFACDGTGELRGEGGAATEPDELELVERMAEAGWNANPGRPAALTWACRESVLMRKEAYELRQMMQAALRVVRIGK